MATAAELREQLDALEAIPPGVKQIQFRGQMLTYRTFDDIQKAKRVLRAEIDAATGTRRSGLIGRGSAR